MPDPKPKRPAPFCIRLSAAERAQLERDAGKMPLGAYVKSRLFGRGVKADRHPAAHMLGALGQSEILNYLEKLEHAHRAGLIALTPELEAPIPGMKAALRKLRDYLMAQLGFRGAS